MKRRPEDNYKIIINADFVEANHPWWGSGKVRWDDLQRIVIINTDKGPWLPDVWLKLVGSTSFCQIPQGAKGFEEVYEIVSNYDGFNFENFIESMTCTDNATFVLWEKGVCPEMKICSIWQKTTYFYWYRRFIIINAITILITEDSYKVFRFIRFINFIRL